MKYDLIVIGAGPAGLTAAIYARRAGKSVLLIEKNGFGGQMTFSPKIENYPGFVSGSGSELADKMVEQALSQGAEVEFAEARTAARVEDGFAVNCDTGDYRSLALIIAAGAKHRRLGVPGEAELIGNGISFCAVCDGAFYAGQNVAVIGGGNSALVEALQLAEICRSVTVLQDLPHLTGEKKLIDAVTEAQNVSVICGARVLGFSGDGVLRKIRYRQADTEKALSVSGAFIAIGLIPEVSSFSNLLSLDEAGYVSAGEDCRTECEGVFVAGDCRKKGIRQISTAIADGASAALAACAYLDTLNK